MRNSQSKWKILQSFRENLCILHKNVFSLKKHRTSELFAKKEFQWQTDFLKVIFLKNSDAAPNLPQGGCKAERPAYKLFLVWTCCLPMEIFSVAPPHRLPIRAILHCTNSTKSPKAETARFSRECCQDRCVCICSFSPKTHGYCSVLERQKRNKHGNIVQIIHIFLCYLTIYGGNAQGKL